MDKATALVLGCYIAIAAICSFLPAILGLN